MICESWRCDNLPAQCSFLENESSNHIQSTTIQTTFLQAKGLKAALTITTATYHWTSVVWCRDHLVSLPGVPCLWCTTVGASKISFLEFPSMLHRSPSLSQTITMWSQTDKSHIFRFQSWDPLKNQPQQLVRCHCTELLPWSSTSKYLI